MDIGLDVEAFDAHFHLRPEGNVVDVLKRFSRAGGTGINLICLPDYSMGHQSYYEQLYERTIKLGEIARNSGLLTYLTLGPYPLDYFFWAEAGKDPLFEMMRGVEIAAELCKVDRCNGIGEVGRPHFPVEEKVNDVCNLVLIRAFEVSADLNVPVILHTEDLDYSSLCDMASMAAKSGANLSKIVKHHADPAMNSDCPEMRRSVLATRPNTRLSISKGVWNFMLESDFVDDPSKPGKVIPEDSVPKRAIMIREQYENADLIMEKIFKEVPEKVFLK